MLQTSKSQELMPPPPLPLHFQAEAAILTETVKKPVVKRQRGYDAGNKSVDPSYRDQHDRDADSIVQQATRHSILPESHRADLTFYLGMGAGYTRRLLHFCPQFGESRVYLHSPSMYSDPLYLRAH